MENKQTRLTRTTRKLLLCSAIASLTCGSGAAFGLGIGQIQVRSALNQQLTVEIPLLPDNARELDSLQADISYQTYAGSAAGSGANSFNYSVVNRGGRSVLRIVSARAVREPLVNLLVELRWDTGHLLREFAVLLDPAGSAGNTALRDIDAMSRSELQERPRRGRSDSQTRAPAQPQPTPPPARAVASPPPAVPAEPAAVAAVSSSLPELPVPELQTAANQPASTGSSTEQTAGSGRYGPVASGESLWAIAERTRPEGVSTAQMMRDIQRANPSAFVRGNPNTLMRGVTLEIPGASGRIAPVGDTTSASPAAVAAVPESSPVNELPGRSTALPPGMSTQAPEPVAVSDDRGGSPEVPEESPIEDGSSPAAVPEPSPSIPGVARIAMSDDGVGLRPAGMEELRERMAQAQPDSPSASPSDGGADSLSTSAPESPVSSTVEPPAVAPEPEPASLPRPVAVSEPEVTPPEPVLESGSAGAEPLVSVGAEPLTLAGAEPPVSVGAEPPVSAGTEPPVSVGAEPPVSAGAEPPVSAGAEPPVSVGAEPPVSVGAEPPVSAGAEPPVSAVAELPVPVGTESQPSLPTEPEVARSRPLPDPQLSAIQKALIWVRDPSNLQILGGGLIGLILLIWLAVKMLTRRRAAAVEEDDYEEDHLSEEDVFTESDQETIIEGSTSSVSLTKGDDPVERADMMLELGDHEQAEEVLLSALDEQPENPDLRTKLLEVYHQAGDTAQFTEQAGIFAQKLGNKRSDPRWQRVVAMGRELAPNNPLFGAADDSGVPTRRVTPDDDFAPASFDDEEDATAIFSTDATDATAPTTTGASGGDMDMDFDFGDLGEPSESETVTPEDEFDQAFDFNFDDEENAPATPPAAAVASAGAADVEDETLLDFDIGDTTEQASDEPPPRKAAAADGDDFGGMDFGFGDDDEDMTSIFATDAADDDSTGSDLVGEELGSSDDFAADLDSSDSTALGGGTGNLEDETLLDLDAGSLFDSEPVGVPDDADDSLSDELAGFDFDLPSGEEPSITELETEGNDELFASDDDDSTELELLGDRDSADGDGEFFAAEDYVETKLDLANAYIDMEDPVGARSLLEEVLKEGNSEQQQRAEALMQRLS